MVGYYIDPSGNYHGFLYGGGTYSTIDYPGAMYTSLYGINDFGQIVGQAENSIGFLYDVPTQTFTSIACPHAFYTIPFAINNSGTIAGVIVYQGFVYGFEIVGTRCTHIAPPGTDDVFVSALTAKGGVVGNVDTVAHQAKYFVFDGNYKPFNLPATDAQLNGVNPAGTAVVGYYSPSTGVTAGFLYENRTLTTLQFPGSTYTRTFGINSSGQIVGAFGNPTTLHGFTWTPSADTPER